MNRSVIELKNVTKVYKLGKVDVLALHKISFKIYKDEFLAIVGKSGSGKSTCLSIIGCLDLPTSGKVKLLGKDVTKMSENELARLRGKTIGFVFQTFNLIPTLTTLENVTLPMMFQGIEQKERIKRAKRLLKLVGLEKRLYHKPLELSGGERQRVAIARALANKPQIILADEPTGNLDSKTGKMIIELLERINRAEGTTLVIVTHDLDLARRADRIIELEDGKIVREIKKRKSKYK